MSSSGEENEPSADQKKAAAEPEAKHWLEYAVFLFVILTAIGTGAAAYYTRQQWITAEDTERRQLRAYLVVEAGNITGVMSADRAVATVITVKPLGQTPAYNVRLAAGMFVLPVPLPSNVALAVPNGTGQPLVIYSVLNGPPAQKEISIQFRQDELRSMHDGNSVIYLIGRVTYADIFGDEWPCEFCFEFGRDGVAHQEEKDCKPYSHPR